MFWDVLDLFIEVKNKYFFNSSLSEHNWIKEETNC